MSLEVEMSFGVSIVTKTFERVTNSDLPSSSTRIFSSLKRVSLFADYDPCRDDQRPQFSDFQSLFYLPYIETIRATAIEPCAAFTWPASPPVASTLTVLQLCQSHVREEGLEELLVAAPNLKSFEYNFLCDIDLETRHSGHLDCSKLGRSLQKVKASLETLMISVAFFVRTAHDVEAGNPSHWGIKGDLGTLSGFTKLKTLDVPFAVLMGFIPHSEVQLADVLPCALHKFCCTNSMASWDAWRWTDEAVVAQFREYTGAETSLDLEYLELRAIGSFHLWYEEVQAQVAAMCEDAGIWFEYNRDY